MKKLLLILLSFGMFLPVYAQTDGISYQAVIIDPVIQELPGVDISGNILPNRQVALRFTFYDSNNTIEYQEVHVTTTDQFGMVNLMIGRGEATIEGTGDFTLLDWDGTPKDLQVDINFAGETTDFESMSRQELTFVPYAYHRDITATGDMIIDGTTDLNGRLLVQGPTDLNSSLNVNNQNATDLSGTLTVGGNTELGADLMVEGVANLNDSLRILGQSPTFFTGDITVEAAGTATFNGPTVFNAPANFTEINVAGPSNLSGQVTINANLDTVGGQDIYDAYPLLIQGSGQGMAIKVNGGRSISNNYLSFWDQSTGEMWGRIEGITLDELHNDPEYQTELALRITDVIINGIEAGISVLESGQAVVKLTAAGTSSTACAGLGACVTAPIPSLIAESSSNLVLKIANAVSIAGNLLLAIAEEESFRQFSDNNIGVSYQSGAGDYAEWLPKENTDDEFRPGEVVGVTHGKVSKNTSGVEKVMVVSTRPIVLGNMPEEGKEDDYVKIAFMGQVPVRVIGRVSPGDYIMPSELGNGFAKAVNPDEMNTMDYQKVCGEAWNVIEKLSSNVSLVNCAVGLNNHHISHLIVKQEEELKALKTGYSALQKELDQNNMILAALLPGYAEAKDLKVESKEMIAVSNQDDEETEGKEEEHYHEDENIIYPSEDDVVYFEVTEEQVASSFDMAREQYINMYQDNEMSSFLFDQAKGISRDLGVEKDFEQMLLVNIDDHPFWKKIDNNPAYKEEIMSFIMKKIEKAYHTHESYADKFTNLQRKN